MTESSHRVGQLAVLLAVASGVATVGVYALALVPLLLSGAVALSPSRAFAYGALGVFLGVTIVRSMLVVRLAPHEQAFVRFWVHAPFFTFLVASVLGALPILLAVSAGPSLGWSPETVSWVVRAVSLTVLVLSAVLVRVLWYRHQASLENPPAGPGTRAA